MTNMKEFYEKYNLNKYNFAEMAHVGTRSLIKYEQGKSLREETKTKIEKAVHVIEKHDLVRPRYEPGFHDMWYKNQFYKQVLAYTEQFRILLRKEL